jgi:hypothetical protein
MHREVVLMNLNHALAEVSSSPPHIFDSRGVVKVREKISWPAFFRAYCWAHPFLNGATRRVAGRSHCGVTDGSLEPRRNGRCVPLDRSSASLSQFSFCFPLPKTRLLCHNSPAFSLLRYRRYECFTFECRFRCWESMFPRSLACTLTILV